MLRRTFCCWNVALQTARSAWKSDVATLVEEKKQTAAERQRQRIARVRDERDYTPVEKVFPEYAAGDAASDGGSTSAMPEQQSAPKAAAAPSPAAPAATAVATQPADAHAVRVAVVGPPNAGKSSLVNSLVSAHVSATARASGTTKRNTIAVATAGNTQMRFIDTPGMFVPGGFAANRAKHRYDATTAYAAFDSLMAADVALLCLNGSERHIEPDDVGIARKVRDMCARREVPLVLAVTKMDLVNRVSLQGQQRYRHFRTSVANTGIEFVNTFETSAKSFSGVLEVKDFVSLYGKPGSWLHYRDESTALSPPMRAEEALREALQRHMPVGLVPLLTPRIVGWTKRKRATELYIEVFAARPTAMAVFYQSVAAISDHFNQRLSYELNTKITVVFHVLVAPGGIRDVRSR